jgi:hypothetical protein
MSEEQQVQQTEVQQETTAPQQSPDEMMADAFNAMVGSSAPERREAPAPEQAKESQPDKQREDIESLLRRDAEVSRRKREHADGRSRLLEEIKTKAKEDKLAAVKELGIDPSELFVEFLAGTPAVPPKKKDEAAVDDDPRIAQLKQEIQELKGEFAQKRQVEQQQQLATYRDGAVRSAKGWLSENVDKFELVANHPNGPEFLLDTLVAKAERDRDYYESNNTTPAWQDVAESVNEYAKKNCTEQLQWMIQQKTLQPLILEAAKKITGKPAIKAVPTKPRTTLDNDLTTERATEDESDLSVEQRVALATKRVALLQSQQFSDDEE